MEDWLIKCFPQQDTHLLNLLNIFIVILMGIYKLSSKLMDLFYCLHVKKWSIKEKMTENLKYVIAEMFILGMSHISHMRLDGSTALLRRFFSSPFIPLKWQNSMQQHKKKFWYKKSLQKCMVQLTNTYISVGLDKKFT